MVQYSLESNIQHFFIVATPNRVCTVSMTNKSQGSISHTIATEQAESNTKKLPFAFCCTMALQKVAKKWDDMAKVQKSCMSQTVRESELVVGC